MYYVYCHTSPNNKLYFGVCNRKPESRWGKNGINYKGQLVFKAIQKYGWDNIEHDVLFKTEDLDEAVFLENFLISKFNTIDKNYGYNISPGNYNTSWNLGLTKETSNLLKLAAEKSGKTQKERYAKGELVAWIKGKTKETDERVANLAKSVSKSKKGTKWSKQRREAQPDMHGKNNSNFDHKWDSSKKELQSKKLKEGFKRGRVVHNAISVYCEENKKSYKSLHAAEVDLHLDRHKISKCCKGELDSVNGYHLRYC